MIHNGGTFDTMKELDNITLETFFVAIIIYPNKIRNYTS
jgi:hypothetical protein